MMCEKCMKTAINSYTFIKSAKDNCEQLYNTLKVLSNCIENPMQGLDECHTLFISIDTDNFTSRQFYDYKQLAKPSQATGLKRFQSLTSTENVKQELEDYSHKIKTERDEKDFYKKKKKNHRHKFKSKESNLMVPIPTSEMLYDKYNRENLKCKDCLKDFPSLSNLRNHYIRVHAPKVFKCSICSRKFGSQSILDAHEKESHCTLVCSECGKTFHNRHTLKMHEMGHEGIKLVCHDCGRIYKSHTTFKKHIDLNVCGQQTRANPAKAKFTCDYCNKKYTQKVSLRVHIQHEHGTYKSHECKWCKKKFWAQSRLKAHIVKHTQEKKFHCDICGGNFVTKESLLYHTRTHTGEKPYKCEHCDSRFLSASRRAEHVKSQHLNATLKCDICNCKFKTQLCLQKHKNMHSNQNNSVSLFRQAFPDDINVQIMEDDKIYLEVSDDCDDFNIGIPGNVKL
ncbi:zinc finger protein 510-like [Battus philenor]|uniref:zinc finger protein 510-like n=1 Tax=Battus philenor TaxID=42288 RepID=UPI0035D12512